MPRPTPGPLAADARLRAELADLLRGGHAHVPPLQAFAGVPPGRVNERPDGLPYSLWDLLEHVRIATADLLAFTLTRGGPGYEPLDWPDAYWPDGPGTADGWRRSLATLSDDLDAVVALVESPATDLFAEFEHAPGYTALREVLLVADHTAHHAGEAIAVRRALGLWPPGDGTDP